MVCISCIVIPVVLWLWHRFLQPLVVKFWNPWGSVEEGAGGGSAAPLKCPFSSGSDGTTDRPTTEANGVDSRADHTDKPTDHVKAD